MKNKILKTLSISLAVILFAAFISINASPSFAAGGRDDGAVLRVGAQPFPLYSSIYVAYELGFLKEELDAIGAKFEWTEFNSGPLVNEAVAAGTQDIGFMADQPAIVARASGLPIQIIGGVAYGERALALLVPADSPVTKVEELRGKKIALTVGSYAQHLLVLLLEGAGLSVSDIELINLPASEQPATLSSGQVDAIVVWEQYISLLETSGTAKVLADGTGVKRGNMVTYAIKEYAEKHPLVIEAYIKAGKRASDYIAANPKAAASAVAKRFGVTDEVMEKILGKFSFSPELSPADIAEITKVKDYLLAAGIIKNDVDMGEFINTSYSKSALGK